MVAKWAAIVAVAWSTVVLVLSVYSPEAILLAVKLSMPPVLIAGVAWGTARSARARRVAFWSMMALWFCLIAVFVSQVQYNGAVANNQIQIVKPGSQTEQSQ